MNDKLVDKATEYIDAIASKLGVAAEHVYDILVKHAIVSGIRDIILALVLGAVTYGLVRLSKWLTTSDEAFEFESYAPFVLFIGLVAFALAIISLYFGIGELINPEYYAIKEILDAFGGK
ncbi:hypothetical protein WD019_02355 [Fictibacillus sp. Mic-4]|uniref:hypothetical protein n=1 Tax=Fictibacillus sp. Mic-4 TaxID=3132826 RepID=UPI003CEC6AB4